MNFVIICKKWKKHQDYVWDLRRRKGLKLTTLLMFFFKHSF